MLARGFAAARMCRQCQRLTAVCAKSTSPALVASPIRTPIFPSQIRSISSDAHHDNNAAANPGSDPAFAQQTAQSRPSPHEQQDFDSLFVPPPESSNEHDEAEFWKSLDDGSGFVTEKFFSEAKPTPWYLAVDEPLPSTPQRPDPLPTVPDDTHPILQPLIEYVYHDMGLDKLTLLDLRELERSTALGHNLIMLIGTARSERHIQVAGLSLTRWLRREHNISAMAAGLISPAEVKVKLRRLRKRAQLVGGSAGAAFEGKAHGLSTGWMCVNLGTLGESKGEQANVDEYGRLSGFGRVVDGNTIVVQCMTEKKRAQLDLEGLWAGNLEKHKKLLERLEGPSRVMQDGRHRGLDSVPAPRSYRQELRARQRSRS